jgi:hypothetical protein
MKYTLEERLALVTLGFSPLELLGERFAEADEALTTLNESEELKEAKVSVDIEVNDMDFNDFKKEYSSLVRKAGLKFKSIRGSSPEEVEISGPLDKLTDFIGDEFPDEEEYIEENTEELDEKSTSSERKKAAKAMAKKRKSSSFRKKEGKQAKKREGKRKDPKRSKAAKMGARHRT